MRLGMIIYTHYETKKERRKKMYDKIKEHLKYAITCYKKDIQIISEQQKFSEDNGGDGDHEFNCIMNAQDSITEYQKILNFVEECEDDWKWICGNGTKEIGVGKSNWGTLNYPNKENPLIVKKSLNYKHFNDFDK